MNSRFDMGSDSGIGCRHPRPQPSYLNRTQGDIQGGRASFAWLDPALLLIVRRVRATLCSEMSQVAALFF
jgi:hypothetical protein